MASMTDAEKAAAHSKAHQKWILDTLKENNGSCSYEKLVEVGEEHQCDTVGAMLKILKNRKLIHFKQMFLMFPMHKDEIVTLLNNDGSSESTAKKKKAVAADNNNNKKKVESAKKKVAPILFKIGDEVITDNDTRSACLGVITKVPTSGDGQYGIKFYGWKAGKEANYAGNKLTKATESELQKLPAKSTTKGPVLTSNNYNDNNTDNVDNTSLENDVAKLKVNDSDDKKVENNNSSGDSSVFYTHDQLKHPGPFPEGVDVTKRETYLSEEDTEKLFGMSKEALAAMPKWKRNNLKKKVQLF